MVQFPLFSLVFDRGTYSICYQIIQSTIVLEFFKRQTLAEEISCFSATPALTLQVRLEVCISLTRQ